MLNSIGITKKKKKGLNQFELLNKSPWPAQYNINVQFNLKLPVWRKCSLSAGDFGKQKITFSLPKNFPWFLSAIKQNWAKSDYYLEIWIFEDDCDQFMATWVIDEWRILLHFNKFFTVFSFSKFLCITCLHLYLFFFFFNTLAVSYWGRVAQKDRKTHFHLVLSNNRFNVNKCKWHLLAPSMPYTHLVSQI